ncbi:MAG TPA: glycoside hydrolase family 27 protein [Steroidobacteraceae bacterium]|nr:glycoside hydrolase family 27 protein [Steroidobacteraceae bacterium]
MRSIVRLLLMWLVCGMAAAQAPPPAGAPPDMPAGGPPPAAPRVANGLALTPPMGWNSWNRFGCNINETLIRQTADAIVASGMKDAGYQYVIIDDCWHGQRDAAGNIQPDATRFPSGIKALADYVHSRGLKFGIYSDAGERTCGGKPGSRGHEYQDAAQYAAWGADYLKYDWCNTGTEDAHAAYLTMSDALRATNRDIVFSMCEWGTAKPWLWGETIGNLWRTSGDIYDHWQGKKAFMLGVLDILDLQADLYPYAGPGHWNDPDMLEVGNGGMTDTEYRAHFSLWAMLAAPLIAGNDVANMSAATRAILLNRDVIAVDQDALGAQARRVWKNGDFEIWARPLKGGARAVLLLNRSAQAAPMTLQLRDLQLPDALRVTLRDLWKPGSAPIRMKGHYTTTVPSHGVALYRLAIVPESAL